MAEFHLVAKTSEIPEDEAKRVVVGERAIAIFNLGGEFYATDDVCTHAYASLSEGYVEEGQVECPLHAGVFDIKTGEAKELPVVENINTYPVRVEGEDIYVEV